MWAQLISMRLKAGSEHELSGVMDALDDVEQPGSGLLRSITMTEQGDPQAVHVLVVFDSEERARGARTTNSASRHSSRCAPRWPRSSTARRPSPT